MGNISKECDGTSWLVEEYLSKKTPVLIARAVVTPRQGKIPVRILNLKAEPLTIYRGTRIATAEPLKDDPGTVSAVNEDPNVERERCSLVDTLMETLPAELSKSQQE